MTDGSLPEGLVDRCRLAIARARWDEAERDWPIGKVFADLSPDDQERHTRRVCADLEIYAVLAVAAPALREQALREAVETMRSEVDASASGFSVAMAIANNTPSTMKRFMEGIIKGEGIKQWLKPFEEL